MAEYISREAAIEKLNRLCNRVCQYSKAQRKYMCCACPLGDAFTVIEDDIPAADVRPVVHGEWLRTQAYPHRIYCSNCYVTFIRNDEFLELKETPHNFCPNCGADMREENK